MDFLKDITFKPMNETSAIAAHDFKEVNHFANIPMRFSNVILGEHHTDEESKVKEFASLPVNDQVLLISGNVGVGKTTLLCGAIHERDILGLPCGEYLSCRMLCAKIRTSRSFSAKVNEEELYEHFAKVPFLVIDELGKAEDSAMERRFIATLLCMRFDNMLPTIIATNLGASQVKDFLMGDGDTGVDILDRLKTTLDVISLDKTSYR